MFCTFIINKPRQYVKQRATFKKFQFSTSEERATDGDVKIAVFATARKVSAMMQLIGFCFLYVAYVKICALTTSTLLVHSVSS